jgi:hypothetical protein
VTAVLEAVLIAVLVAVLVTAVLELFILFCVPGVFLGRGAGRRGGATAVGSGSRSDGAVGRRGGHWCGSLATDLLDGDDAHRDAGDLHLTDRGTGGDVELHGDRLAGH